MGRAGEKLLRGARYAARLASAERRARVFVREVLTETFKQETTDAQVNEIARSIVKNFDPRLLRDPPD